jgi:hypothetical protein
LREVAEEAVIALPPVGHVGQAAAVDAVIAASERTRPESNASVLKGFSADWREGRAADRVAAWLTGLTLFGSCQARTGREEQDARRPTATVRLRHSSRS